MKKRYIFCILALFMIIMITACDQQFATIHSIISGGSVYFQSGNSSRNLRSSGESGDIIEFYVLGLFMLDDNSTGQTFIIHYIDQDTGFNNSGWYDIAGINRKRMQGELHFNPHSNVNIIIQAIRINDKTFRYNRYGFPPAWVEFTGDVDLGDQYRFGLVAGTGGNPNHPGIIHAEVRTSSFAGVSGIRWLSEFVIFVDESALHEDGVLKDNWYESFSFSAR
jgi:hypothetical protein